MLFTGDLWQLKAIGCHPLFSTAQLKGRALEGQRIWHSLNEFAELTENFRFKNDPTTTLMDFLRGAREGQVDNNLLMKVNSRIVLSRQQAIQSTSPLASWVAHTKASVAKYNEYDFKEKVEKGKAHYRIVSKHTSASQLVPHPTKSTREALFKIIKPRGAPTHIDLAIGSRVSVVRNLGTQISNKNTTTCYITRY